MINYTVCIVLCCKNIAIFLEYDHVTDAGYSNYSEAQNDSSDQDSRLTVTLYQFPHWEFKRLVGVFYVSH